MLNIENARKKEDVTLVDIGDLIGKNYRTVREKIANGTFTTAEAFKIYETFFKARGYDFTYLFTPIKEPAQKGTIMKKIKKGFESLEPIDIALSIIGSLMGVVIGTVIFYLFIRK